MKGWEWTGGQYGTEGVLKSITLVNRSSDNWKDIKIRVDFLGIPGAKVGVRGFTSRAVIHDLLPANGERTYTNINVGFRHPDARSVDISVMSAKPISEKELKVKMAKKEGKRAVKKKKKKSTAQGDGTAAPGEEGGTIPESDKELSLSERYKQKLAQERGEIPGTPEAGTEPAEGTESVKDAMTGEGGEETAAAGTEEGEEVVEEEEEYEYEEEVPLPSEDIVVEDLKWGGRRDGHHRKDLGNNAQQPERYNVREDRAQDRVLFVQGRDADVLEQDHHIRCPARQKQEDIQEHRRRVPERNTAGNPRRGD